MPATRLTSALAQHALAVPPDSRPDAELLHRFRTARDEVAFAALVARHTPAVRAVCRTWLRSAADLDDAAQATFLVLVQRLDAIREPAALPAWLYGVAANVARRLRQQTKHVGALAADVPALELVADERSELLADEVARLPEKYRLPIQLCYAAGFSTQEAAGRLACPTATLVTRLARGRDLLRRRLAARGVTVGVALGTAAAGRGVSAAWVWTTVHAAVAVLAGQPAFGVSDRTVSLSQGVARTMFWKNLKLLAAAVMIATGLIGFVIGQWASADAPKKEPAAAKEKEPAKPAAKDDDAKPEPAPRRREAVIRLPAGTFVKEVEVAPYGSGRITWNYEDDKVLGLIEGNVMGVEFEIETEAEISLSSNGTVYGVVNSAKVTHLKVGGELAEELGEFAAFLPLAEPLINEMLTDLPFSYQFRTKGDRLTILSYRALMAGPNPLTKLAPLLGGDLDEIGQIFLVFQAFSTAMEGTYTSAEAKEKDAPKKRPLFRKPVEVPKRSNTSRATHPPVPHLQPSVVPGGLPVLGDGPALALGYPVMPAANGGYVGPVLPPDVPPQSRSLFGRRKAAVPAY